MGGNKSRFCLCLSYVSGKKVRTTFFFLHAHIDLLSHFYTTGVALGCLFYQSLPCLQNYEIKGCTYQHIMYVFQFSLEQFLSQLKLKLL